MQISQPDEGGENSAFLVYGRFNVTVKIAEYVEPTSGVTEALSQTTYNLDNEKGYFWTTQSN